MEGKNVETIKRMIRKHFLEKINERQDEAKVVRKVVLSIVLTVIIMAQSYLGGGYLYINLLYNQWIQKVKKKK